METSTNTTSTTTGVDMKIQVIEEDSGGHTEDPTSEQQHVVKQHPVKRTLQCTDQPSMTSTHKMMIVRYYH